MIINILFVSPVEVLLLKAKVGVLASIPEETFEGVLSSKPKNTII